MPESIVDSLFKDNQALVSYLQSAGEVSLQSNAEGNFAKLLLLSAASYFEHLLTENLVRIFSDTTNGSEPVVEFIKNKAVSRQYHTYFQWEGRNANSFFGLFGANFREFMVAQVLADSELNESIRAFLEIGEMRNRLIHLNFANFPLDKTVDEIYFLYQSALSFVERFSDTLKEFLDNNVVGARPGDVQAET